MKRRGVEAAPRTYLTGKKPNVQGKHGGCSAVAGRQPLVHIWQAKSLPCQGNMAAVARIFEKSYLTLTSPCNLFQYFNLHIITGKIVIKIQLNLMLTKHKAI